MQSAVEDLASSTSESSPCIVHKMTLMNAMKDLCPRSFASDTWIIFIQLYFGYLFG